MSSDPRLVVQMNSRRTRIKSENIYLELPKKTSRTRLQSDGNRPVFAELSNYNSHLRNQEYHDVKISFRKIVSKSDIANTNINRYNYEMPSNETTVNEQNINQVAASFLRRHEHDIPTKLSSTKMASKPSEKKYFCSTSVGSTCENEILRGHEREFLTKPSYTIKINKPCEKKYYSSTPARCKIGSINPFLSASGVEAEVRRFAPRASARIPKSIQEAHIARMLAMFKPIDISPIKPHDASLSERPTMIRHIIPQRKMTLAKKTKKVDKYNDVSSYTVDTFNREYLDDVISEAFYSEYKFVLPRNFYYKCNPCLELRMKMVYWLISIQNEIDINGGMFFITVNLFDVILSKLAIPTSMYKLVMVTVAWLVNKYYGTKILMAPKLLRLCKDSYFKDEILNMEYKLLRFFKYNLNTADPTIFANYYLHKLNVPEHNILSFVTYYLMEGFTFNPLYSTYPPSMIAAAAIYLSITRLCPNDGTHFMNVKNFYSLTELSQLVSIMYKHAQNVPSDPYGKVVFFKYNTENAKYASEKFSNCK